MTDRATICLAMIVKDEAPVIARCLESVKPFIDGWVICDTGSNDGTQEAVRANMNGVNGFLAQREWVDFGHNRTEVLDAVRAYDHDYTLIIDADDVIETDPGFVMPPLTADAYTIEIRQGPIVYRRTQLIRSALPWRYEGVLHEFLTCRLGPDQHRNRPGELKTEHLPGIAIRMSEDGARRRSGPERFLRDAKVLREALEAETDRFLISRYTFYLAQSYRDAGMPAQALDFYRRRLPLGFWDQEVWYSLLQIARLTALIMPSDVNAVVDAFVAAHEACPARAEALHGLARFYRHHNDFERGYAAAKRAAAIPLPADGLFIETYIYRFGAADEMAVCAFWTGRYEESLSTCRVLLALPDLPEPDRIRIAANADACVRKLSEEAIASWGRAPGTEAPARVAPVAEWSPPTPMGGTELFEAGLRQRLGSDLDRINFRTNYPGDEDGRPAVVLFQHDADQGWVQWCREPDLIGRVARFVFVSDWQRNRYLQRFPLLPAPRCTVLRNATAVPAERRVWAPGPPWRFAFTSTPFRGLDVLLDAWEILRRDDAELHVWSSMRLYAGDDTPYRALIDRAKTLRGVIYQGIVPNPELKEILRGIHFLAYPSTFPETSCLAAIDAMAAGCRVIVPTLGALAETTCGYARLYEQITDKRAHAERFAAVLADEIANPWGGDPALSIAQQAHCAAVYDWAPRAAEWRRLIGEIAG
jgi:glycosyltransferase involved in cell wall biosynthesis